MDADDDMALEDEEAELVAEDDVSPLDAIDATDDAPLALTGEGEWVDEDWEPVPLTEAWEELTLS